MMGAFALGGCAAQAEQDAVEYESIEGALQFSEVMGLVSIEAEDFTTSAPGWGPAAGSRWTRVPRAGWSSGAALFASPNTGVRTVDPKSGPRLDYRIDFKTPGRYYAWIRMRGPHGNDDALHVGFNWTVISRDANGVFDYSGAWHWEQYSGSRRLSFDVPRAGRHTFHVWMREDGVQLDKIVLTRDARYVPNGLGPAQTVTRWTGGGAGTGGAAGASGSAGQGGAGGSGGSASAGSGGSGMAGSGGSGMAGSGDSGMAGSGMAGSGGSGMAGSGGSAGSGETACVRARRLWFEDFETGNYARWSGNSYVSTLNPGGCYQSGFSTEQVRSGRSSHRVSISCTAGSNHRVYGGVQFSGDMPIRYTNSGSGIDAPNGIVVTFWSWLDAPGFGNGRWFNFFTSNNSCDWSDTVVTHGLEDPSNRLTPAHIMSTGGTVTWSPTRTAVPFRRWVRTTVYLNYHRGELHVWQDGVSQYHATFRRRNPQICQFHWGLYANGSNSNIVLFEDDMSIWKLEQPLAGFDREPYLGETTPVCQ